MIFQIFIINFLIAVITTLTVKDEFYTAYDAARDSILKSEALLTTGGHLYLNNRELQASHIFWEYKNDELRNSFRNPEYNAAGMHFFRAKQLIERSKVFKFVQKMPKGAVLRMHHSASVSSQWVVKTIFYMPGILRCINKDGYNILTFRQQPEKHGCVTAYVRISDERQKATSSDAYDQYIENIINLYTPRPELDYNSGKRVWTKFQNTFDSLSDALLYLPAYRAYHWQMLEELYIDNIMYAEIRMNFNELYDTYGRTYPPERTLDELITLVEQFKQQRPKFLGLKIIWTVDRNALIGHNFEKFKKLHYAYPNYVIGFDLVGQEDTGSSLYSLAKYLKDKPQTSKFFFQAGETNWYGGLADTNLLDALLLNTTRIGHGYALTKHPVLLNDVKKRGVALEVCPISNQILHLLWDLRNHPGSVFMSQDIPIVICNDKPGLWNAKGLSYDFYYAIMSLAPNEAGLRMLKQLVWNSIKYSSLNYYEYLRANAMLQSQWDNFINDVLNDYKKFRHAN